MNNNRELQHKVPGEEMNLVTHGGLTAPSDYWHLTMEQREDICNGCGPRNWGWLVPDYFRITKLNLTRACDIHDFCYHIGMDKKKADNLFLDNSLYLSSLCSKMVQPITDWLSFVFYLAVKNGGASAYNKSQERSAS